MDNANRRTIARILVDTEAPLRVIESAKRSRKLLSCRVGPRKILKIENHPFCGYRDGSQGSDRPTFPSFGVTFTLAWMVEAHTASFSSLCATRLPHPRHIPALAVVV